MMDIDRISYIFGSFARRRQSNEPGSAKRRSIEPTKKIAHDRSNSTPHQQKKSETRSLRAKSIIGLSLDENEFKCPLCRRQYIEPRVLPCLHTFCLGCLQELERKELTIWYDDKANAKKTDSTSSKKASSGGSGYASDRHDDSSSKGVCCPTCASRAEIPPGGIASFPPNYPLQHRMVLATLNSHSTHLLCDLCTPDVSAISRCMDCAISFCQDCEELHLRQKFSADHEILTLEEAREKGITKVIRQIMCLNHPEVELSIFCASCFQVICRNCVSSSHRSHMCEPISRAAKLHLTKLRLASDRAKALVEESTLAASRFSATAKKIEAHCYKIQTEVQIFMEEYLRSIEEHKLDLLAQIKRVREEKLQRICKEKARLQKRIKDARDIAYFLDDLLNDGTDVEVLSFVKPVLHKIEKCQNFEAIPDLRCGELKFLPKETVKCPNNFCEVYGILTSQSVSPEHCRLNTDGLQNVHIGKKAEVLLETRDHNNTPINIGGENVMAELRHRNPKTSKASVNVYDKKDGTYNISFVADKAGKFTLNVTVQKRPIKGSPFSITVLPMKPHHGTYHCCSFCSSGGSKEVTCGCEGKMPGDYKGCGHGHKGHPGRRHWSCCGNVLEHSECIRSSQYQFTL